MIEFDFRSFCKHSHGWYLANAIKIQLKGGTTNRNYAVQLNSGNNNGLPQISNVRMMCIELDTSV